MCMGLSTVMVLTLASSLFYGSPFLCPGGAWAVVLVSGGDCGDRVICILWVGGTLWAQGLASCRTVCAVTECLPLLHRALGGQQLGLSLFGQPARGSEGKPSRCCAAHSVPPVHANQEPYGHHHPTPAPCGTRGAESG